MVHGAYVARGWGPSSLVVETRLSTSSRDDARHCFRSSARPGQKLSLCHVTHYLLPQKCELNASCQLLIVFNVRFGTQHHEPC
jgi:hypothetical protein